MAPLMPCDLPALLEGEPTSTPSTAPAPGPIEVEDRQASAPAHPLHCTEGREQIFQIAFRNGMITGPPPEGHVHFIAVNLDDVAQTSIAGLDAFVAPFDVGTFPFAAPDSPFTAEEIAQIREAQSRAYVVLVLTKYQDSAESTAVMMRRLPIPTAPPGRKARA